MKRAPNLQKAHLQASKRQKTNQLHLFICDFLAFQTKYIFCNFLEEVMRPNV